MNDSIPTDRQTDREKVIEEKRVKKSVNGCALASGSVRVIACPFYHFEFVNHFDLEFEHTQYARTHLSTK